MEQRLISSVPFGLISVDSPPLLHSLCRSASFSFPPSLASSLSFLKRFENVSLTLRPPPDTDTGASVP